MSAGKAELSRHFPMRELYADPAAFGLRFEAAKLFELEGERRQEPRRKKAP